MTSSSKDRYYTNNVTKPRRSSPGDSHNVHGGFFNSMGQVPANYSSFTQPRSTPKIDSYNQQALYGAYPQTTGASPQFPTTYANYEVHTHERYSPQPTYPAYPSSRSGTPSLGNGVDARRLPPLSTTPGPQGDRWQQSYIPQQNGYHANPYSYHMQAGPHDVHLSTMNPQGHGLYEDLPRMDPRSASPYGRSSGSSHVPPARSYSPPPVTPISPEEPTIKKKRKRADAAQLKVLNETYARTAFPSTEERIALAKMLDMSARSVQIWFQNKRQSMRQTNRQSTSVASSHHPFSGGNPVDPMAEDLVPHHQPYDTGSGSMGDAMYLTGPSHDASRSHASHSHSHATPSPHYHQSSSHRHPREQDVDPRKWPRAS